MTRRFRSRSSSTVVVLVLVESCVSKLDGRGRIENDLVDGSSKVGELGEDGLEESDEGEEVLLRDLTFDLVLLRYRRGLLLIRLLLGLHDGSEVSSKVIDFDEDGGDGRTREMADVACEMREMLPLESF